MLPESEKCMREILRVSKRINSKKFTTLQEGMRLIRNETLLLKKFSLYAGKELHERHPRYFDQHY